MLLSRAAALACVTFFDISAAANGTISGIVRASDTRLPIAGANVAISSGCILNNCSVRLQTVSASDGGFGFGFSDVPAGSFELDAFFYYYRMDNYLPSSQNVSVVDGASSSATVLMQPGARIRGRAERPPQVFRWPASMSI